MLLTPPDVISQVMLALPMWFLFEAGLLASKFLLKKRLADLARERQRDADENPLTDEEMEAELNKAIEEEARVNKHD
jgi:sec-independent protein translocase protein TatC